MISRCINRIVFFFLALDTKDSWADVSDVCRTACHVCERCVVTSRICPALAIRQPLMLKSMSRTRNNAIIACCSELQCAWLCVDKVKLWKWSFSLVGINLASTIRQIHLNHFVSTSRTVAFVICLDPWVVISEIMGCIRGVSAWHTRANKSPLLDCH